MDEGRVCNSRTELDDKTRIQQGEHSEDVLLSAVAVHVASVLSGHDP